MKIRIILCVFAPMLLVSFCTGICPEPVEVRFNYSRVLPITPENAFAREVSIRIRLIDTIPAHYPFLYGLRDWGIPKAYGVSCMDPFFYVPNQTLTNVKIKTLYNISPTLPALSDVSESFYARPRHDFLFVPIDEFIRYHWEDKFRYSDDAPYREFQIFLRERIDNQLARFVVSVSLSDGRTLTDTTNTISITSN